LASKLLVLGYQRGWHVLTTSALRRGYSLIEVLVTIAVLAAMLAAVTPSVSELMANLRLRGAAEAALNGIQKARSEAVKSNQIVTFWLVSANSSGVLDNSCQLSSTSSSWVVSYDDPTGACATTPSTTDLPRIVQINNAGLAGNTSVSALNTAATASSQLSFDGFGRRPAATAATDISTIDFTSSTTGTQSLRLEISAVGGVRMCDRNAPVTVPPDPKAC
jgi:type IV fimbrial biogenesis protein FimT